ncbi:hypothetical protein ABFX02_11G115100 [Erythranthe guttata]
MDPNQNVNAYPVYPGNAYRLVPLVPGNTTRQNGQVLEVTRVPEGHYAVVEANVVLVPVNHIPIPPGHAIVQPDYKQVPIGSIVEPPQNPSPRDCRSDSRPTMLATPQCMFDAVVPHGHKLVPCGYAVVPPDWTVAPFGVTETMDPSTHFACPTNWIDRTPHNV